MGKLITKKHQIFGEIRFEEGSPYLYDIARSLNYRDDSYLELVKDNIILSEDNIYLVDDKGIDILIKNSNIKIPIIYRQWIEYILPFVRKKTKKTIASPSIPTQLKDIHNKTFNDYLNTIPKENWITIPVHGFSNNCMFEYKKDGHITKSNAYRKWLNRFPTQKLDALSHIDFSKPIQAIYKFDHKEVFDTPNLCKSLSDVIAAYFNTDDHQISNVVCIKGEIVNEYWEGKIHIYMYNEQ